MPQINRMKGFTLVELLIVIALIAVLSVAVLATINPIEQTNKARDAQFKNDAAEVMNAYERYYASQNLYPWNSVVGTGVSSGTNNVAFTSRDPRFGVLNAAHDLPATGELISTSELKSAFGGKAPFKEGVSADDMMYVWHASDSNYVCFCPKANANRTGAVVKQLKCLRNVSADGSAVTTGASLRDAGDAVEGALAACAEASADDIKSSGFCNVGGAYANMLCVPEGSID